MTLSTRRLHRAARGASPFPSLGRSVRSFFGILHVLFLMLVSALLFNQLLQALGCEGGLSFACYHSQDLLLLVGALLSVALAANGAGFFSAQGRIFPAAELAWALLFTWYLWFSLESPLRLHE